MRRGFLTLLFLLLATPAWAAVTFDATAGSSTGFSGSLTFSHTVGAGSNLAICVGVATGSGTNNVITGVTYNGVALTLITSQGSVTGALAQSYIYCLVNPATGANNVVVSAGVNISMMAISASFSGVDQTTPSDANGGSINAFAGSPVSDSITVTAGGMAFDIIYKDGADNLTVGGSQTDLTPHQIETSAHTSAASYLAGATAMAWSFTTGSRVAHAIAALKSASGGGGGGGGGGGAVAHRRIQ